MTKSIEREIMLGSIHDGEEEEAHDDGEEEEAHCDRMCFNVGCVVMINMILKMRIVIMMEVIFMVIIMMVNVMRRRIEVVV